MKKHYKKPSIGVITVKPGKVLTTSDVKGGSTGKPSAREYDWDENEYIEW